MKISGSGVQISLDTGKVQETARVENTAPATGASPAAPAQQPSARLQSAVMQPAAEALRAMPEVDQARVDALRDALAKGEIPFNPVRLASLIEKYHGK